MKKVLIFLIPIGIIFTTGSCSKTYTCKCSYEGSTATYTTGQVKALSKKKAEKRCSGTCGNGTVSVL